MKKYLVFIILAGLSLLFASCASNSDIDNLQSQIDELKSGRIASIENQIFNINGSITTLQEADREIKGYITALQNTASELQKSINTANGKIDDLQKALTLVNTAIETLQAKDSALEKRIDDLKAYVDTQLKNAKDWVSATFATLEQYNGIVSEIGGLRGSISSINTAMGQMESRLDGKITSMKGEIEAAYTKAMGTLETSLKNWVNDQLKGYLTIAETEAKLAALKGSLEKEDESIREDIDKLSASLDSAKTELSEGYKAAIKKAIDENNGMLDGKISEAVSGLNTRIDNEVSTINKRIDEIEKRVANLETQVSALVSRIQSLSYIPRYTDGASTMWYQIKSNGSIEARDTLEFRVSPADCADSLVKVWDKAITAEAVSLATRVTQETVSLPVVSVTGGKGKISVVLDGSSLEEKFFSGEQQIKAVVIISDGNNERTSEYISLVVKEIRMPNNVIYYSSSNREIVTPYKTSVFGTSLISNDYKDGSGVIQFSGDVTGIGPYAFYQCSTLSSIVIPNSVTSIGKDAFGECSYLTSIVIPDSVTSIGDAAFIRCGSLESVEIPNTVISIGQSCFYETGLSSIDIPNSVTSIGDGAFGSCFNLLSIEIPKSVTCINSDAFVNCVALRTIVIPNSITSIGGRAFMYCNSLTSIEIPNSVTSIGGWAFGDCKSLTSIVIPDSVTSIGGYAFSGCSGLISVELSNSLTSISDNSFFGCTGLSSIVIPSSVTSIGYDAFNGCSRLEYITSLATTPPTIKARAFPSNDCPIYVPAESVEAYKAAKGWSDYADRIQAIPNDNYTSNVTWTCGTNAYDDGMATVNGVENVKIYKLGTSTKVGTATIVVPKGAKSVSFYGVSWKGNPATVVVKMGDSMIYSQDLAANDGASSNSPYTITVTDSDHYTMTLPSQLTEDTNVTITTAEGSKTRIILFGIRAE